jgi:hypothetical protein
VGVCFKNKKKSLGIFIKKSFLNLPFIKDLYRSLMKAEGGCFAPTHVLRSPGSNYATENSPCGICFIPQGFLGEFYPHKTGPPPHV